MIIRKFSTRLIPNITVTTNAWVKLETIIKTQNAKGFIFSAESGGCNGFNYKLNIFKQEYELENLSNYTKVIKKTKEFNLDDYKSENKINEKYTNFKLNSIENPLGNVKVYIDPLSEMYLLGTEIDYIFEDINKGIYESKFVFNVDKNFATTCGCGISFNPKV